MKTIDDIAFIFVFLLLYTDFVPVYPVADPKNQLGDNMSPKATTTGVTKAVVCAILSVGWCI